MGFFAGLILFVLVAALDLAGVGGAFGFWSLLLLGGGPPPDGTSDDPVGLARAFSLMMLLLDLDFSSAFLTVGLVAGFLLDLDFSSVP